MSVPPEQQFAVPADYDSWKADEKIDWLWNELILANRHTEVSRPDLTMASPATMFGVVGRRDALARTLDRTDDVMEQGRPKIIHAQGSVALVRLEIDADSPFTGILAPPPSGGARGIMRMSLAVPAVRKAAFTPGFGLKFLVDGQPSLNILAMNHTVGQGRDLNMFANTFTHDMRLEHNELRPPQKLLNFFFSRVSSQPRRLTIDHFAATNSAGEAVVEPVCPGRLVFRPDRDVRRQFRDRPVEDFRSSLAEVNAGSTLYHVEAVDSPEVGHESRSIGRIVLAKKFVTSDGGDRLFFRHQISPEDRIRS